MITLGLLIATFQRSRCSPGQTSVHHSSKQHFNNRNSQTLKPLANVNFGNNSFTAGLKPQKSFSTNRLDIVNKSREMVTNLHIRTNSVQFKSERPDLMKINDDIFTCNGNLNNLKTMIRNRKQKNVNEEKVKMEDLGARIQDMNKHLTNVISSYTKQFIKRTSEGSSSDCLFRDSQSEINLSLPILKPDTFMSLSDDDIAQDNNSSMVQILTDENINHYSLEINAENYFPEEPIGEVYSQLERTANHLEFIETNNNNIYDEENENLQVENINNMSLSIEQISQLEEEKQKLTVEIQQREKDLQNKLVEFECKIKNKDQTIESLNLSIRELMSELEKGEMLRKKLHNYIQELRGNIRVYCRVKPVMTVIFI
jgi:hypothetical protein